MALHFDFFIIYNPVTKKFRSRKLQANGRRWHDYITANCLYETRGIAEAAKKILVQNSTLESPMEPIQIIHLPLRTTGDVSFLEGEKS